MYLLRCSDGSLYAGVTTDPKRRLAQHNAGKGGAYTRARRPVRMAVLETRPNRSSAQRREAEIKAWPREKKQARFRPFIFRAVLVSSGGCASETLTPGAPWFRRRSRDISTSP